MAATATGARNTVIGKALVEDVLPDDGDIGHVNVRLQAYVSYDFAIAMRERLSVLMSPFGGHCESWGALVD